MKKYTSITNSVTSDSLVANTTYIFTVKARDLAGNTSAASTALSATTSSVPPNSGLNYRYYEGNWNLLPNFTTLTPVKTGVSPNVVLRVRNRQDSFGIVWDGKILIPTSGTYT